MNNHVAVVWHRLLAHVSRRERTELRVLLVALAVLALAIAFVFVADNVTTGDSRDFDERVVRALRRAGDPTMPIGPSWLRDGATERMRYNERVQEYNTLRRRFPSNVTAKVFGFKEYPYFEAPPSAQQVPKVNFGR